MGFVRVDTMYRVAAACVAAYLVSSTSAGAVSAPATGVSRATMPDARPVGATYHMPATDAQWNTSPPSAASDASPSAALATPIQGATSGTLSLRPSTRPAVQRPPRSLGSVSNNGLLSAPAQDEVLFWAWDFHKQQYYQVRAVNAYRSASVWVYVEKTHNVPQDAVQAFGRLFDDTIYPTLRGVYGRDPYPGIDNQAAITVLMLDIHDPLHYDAEPFTYYSGYFDPVNQQRQSDLARVDPYLRSNEREMLYVDISPGDPRGSVIKQTLAHEFAHLIHWSYDADEDDWLAEGLSELAVHLCGLGHPNAHVQAFVENPTGSLVSWSGEPADYGRVYLFMLYLHEQSTDSGAAWLRRLVRNPDNGLRSIDTAYPGNREVEEMFRDFVLALFLDRAGASDERYGFASLVLSPDTASGGFALPRAVRHPTGSMHEVVSLEPWEFRADSIPVASGSVEIELLAFGDACAGATWRDAAHDEHPRATCLVSGRPVIWPYANGGREARELLLTIANPSTDRAVIELSSIESLTALSHVERLYLPVAVTH